LVEDSGFSYFLFLNVKQKIDMNGAYRLLDSIRPLVRTKLTTSGRLESDDWDVQIMEIGYGPGKASPDKLREMALLEADRALYTEFELIRPISKLSSLPHIAGFYAFGDSRHRIEHYVYSAAELAAKSHTGSNPLIISVNLYQETDMNVYMNGPSVSAGYEAWKVKFFSRYPNVAMLMLSANYDRYLPIDDIHFALGTKYLVVESPYWEGVLLNLGVPES